MNIRRPLLATVLSIAALCSVLTIGSVTPTPAAAQESCGEQPDAAFASQVSESADASRLWRLYQAYFLRQPDQDGLNYWLGIQAGGATLEQISAEFARSQEFVNRYGNRNDTEFTDLIYSNVLCRPRDNEGFVYWRDLLASGQLNRGAMMILFSESEEYLLRTGTYYSVYPQNEPAGSPIERLVTLQQNAELATMARDGFELVDIPGGRAVRADYSRADVSTSHNRCSIASINANWMRKPSADQGPNPSNIGLGVVNGVRARDAHNEHGVGILGERIDPAGGANIEYVYPRVFSLVSRLGEKNGTQLEHWGPWVPDANAIWTNGWTTKDNPNTINDPSEWRWAIAGIPLVVDGQHTDVVRNYWSSVASDSDFRYTFETTGHSFVAYTSSTDQMLFGSTAGMTTWELLQYLEGQGYDEITKYDGGGSVEFNVNGVAQVRGTSRDPIWFGLGCS